MAVRSREIFRSEQLSARLIHYSPGLFQATHEHARAQMSFLILGDLNETVGRREADVACPAVGVKPSGVRHAAGFGRSGATMLALDLAKEVEPHAFSTAEPCQWLPLEQAAPSLLKTALDTMTAQPLLRDILWDLVPAVGGMAENKPPSAWLKQVRERISDAPESADIGAIADSVGVHRVHLSRRFRSTYGLPPSLYRMRCMASRALSAMLDRGTALADAALAAGFADQSHMTRTLRAQTGLSPARLRNLLAEVTPVQDAGGDRR